MTRSADRRPCAAAIGRLENALQWAARVQEAGLGVNKMEVGRRPVFRSRHQETCRAAGHPVLSSIAGAIHLEVAVARVPFRARLGAFNRTRVGSQPYCPTLAWTAEVDSICRCRDQANRS